jgi:hypothetical protein
LHDPIQRRGPDTPHIDRFAHEARIRGSNLFVIRYKNTNITAVRERDHAIFSDPQKRDAWCLEHQPYALSPLFIALVSYNCESFAHYIATGSLESRQLKEWHASLPFLGLGLALTIGWIWR